jgi:hypothetical protein
MEPVSFKIHVPGKTTQGSSKSRKPQYISQAIASINFQLTAVQPTGGGTYTGSLPTNTLILLSPSNPNCSSDGAGGYVCIISSSAPAPATDTWTVATYSEANLPPPANANWPIPLSIASISQAVTVAGPNNISVATSGVIRSLVFSPASVTTGNVSNSFATAIEAQDGAGYTIVGSQPFVDSNANPITVVFDGCSTHLTPSPLTADFSTTTPSALVTLGVAYDGLASSPSALYCTANTTLFGGGVGFTATYTVNVTTSTGPISWTVN